MCWHSIAVDWCCPFEQHAAIVVQFDTECSPCTNVFDAIQVAVVAVIKDRRGGTAVKVKKLKESPWLEEFDL